MDAIKATLHSYKSLATRKQLQITLEIPEEYAGMALKMLGVPDPSGTMWFGVTRLKENGPASVAPSGGPIPIAEREGRIAPASPKLRSNLAAVLCKENKDFQKWIVDTYWDGKGTIGDYDGLLKRVLRIGSKRELDADEHAAQRFDELTTTFAYRNTVRARL